MEGIIILAIMILVIWLIVRALRRAGEKREREKSLVRAEKERKEKERKEKVRKERERREKELITVLEQRERDKKRETEKGQSWESSTVLFAAEAHGKEARCQFCDALLPSESAQCPVCGR